MSSKDDGAPLPEGWTKQWSRSQKRYFYCHADTKTSIWHFPTEAETADPGKAKRRAEMKAKQEQESGGGQHKPSSKSKSSSSSSSTKRESSKRPISGLGSIVDSSSFANEIKKSKTSSSASSSAHKASRKHPPVEDTLDLADSTNVAIIVPFRDIHPEQNRSRHLSEFVPHMKRFLQKQVSAKTISDFHIYIVEQSDDNRKFNRGKLLNIGFEIAKKWNRRHDVFIFHDVDLLPGDDLGVWYSRFPKTPIHIARVWNRYSNNPKYFGGIVSFSASDMRRINGYPNNYWGWGGEDDEMQKRCERLGIKWDYPHKGTIQDLECMSINQKIDFLRGHKEWKCQLKWELLKEHEDTWKTNGLSDLTYSILNKTSLDKETNKATKVTVDVKLNGNHWSNEKGIDMDFIMQWK